MEDSIAAARPYGVAFVDMRMPPGWDGLETVQRIWQVDPGLQIVFCTAYSDHSHEVLLETLGRPEQFLILHKPFSGVELVQLAMALSEKWRLAKETEVRLEALEKTVADLINGKKDLESSNAELRQFAYVASNDLQEPLRTVRTFTRLLQRRYGDQLDDQARSYMDFTVDSAKRMQLMIKDILDYSMVGRSVVDDEPVDISSVLERLLPTLEDARSAINASIHVGALPVIPGSAKRIRRLFRELISNSMKFRHLERDLEIQIEAQERGDDWLFELRDNGIGFDPSSSDRIFVLFQRLHTFEEYEGTGRGLAVCRKIVAAHGGRIWATGEPEVGASIFFSLSKSPHMADEGQLSTLSPFATPAVRAKLPNDNLARVVLLREEELRVHNLSTSGVALLMTEVAESLAIESELNFDLMLDEGVCVSAKGVVRHHTKLDELGTVVGIEFSSLGQGEFYQVRDYVERHRE